mmetsp:Transcript_13173/g.52569  ORF Transcript_13173/g.52569 Transcript_13173/m.52569 type:complete len:806 (+) Transcript_13173:26-2443(+)
MASAAVALEVVMDTIAIAQFTFELAMLAKTMLDNYGEMKDELEQTIAVLTNTVDLLRNLQQYENSQIEGVQHQIERVQTALTELSAYLEKVTAKGKGKSLKRFLKASGISGNLRSKRCAVTMAFEAMNITMTTIRTAADTRRASGSIFEKEGRDFWITTFGDANYEVTTREFINGFSQYMDDRLSDVRSQLMATLALGDNDFVSCWDFNSFLNWFGPMHSCLDNFRQVAKRDWFVGDMDGPTAHLQLQEKHRRGAPVAGSFLVRFSATKPGALALDYYAATAGGVVKQKCLILPRTKDGASGLKFQTGETYLNLLDLLRKCQETLALDPSFLSAAAETVEAPMGLSSITYEGPAHLYTLRKQVLRSAKGAWLRRYVKLSGTTLLIYEKAPFFHTQPVDSLDLRNKCKVELAQSSHECYTMVGKKETTDQLLVFTFRAGRGEDEEGTPLQSCFQFKLPTSDDATALLELVKKARAIARNDLKKEASQLSYGVAPIAISGVTHSASSPQLMPNPCDGAQWAPPQQQQWTPPPQQQWTPPPVPVIPEPAPALLWGEFVYTVDQAAAACPYFSSMKGPFFEAGGSVWNARVQARHATVHDMELRDVPAYRQAATALHKVARHLLEQSASANDTAWGMLFTKLQSLEKYDSVSQGWWQSQFAQDYEVDADRLLKALAADPNVSMKHATLAVRHLTNSSMLATVSQFQFNTLVELFGLNAAYPNLAQFSATCHQLLSESYFMGYADEQAMRKALASRAQAGGGNPWAVRLSHNKLKDFVLIAYYPKRPAQRQWVKAALPLNKLLSTIKTLQ